MSVEEIVEGISGYMETDGFVDYIGLMEGLGTIGRITSIVLGLLVVTIVIFMPIVIAVEVCYINFPVFRDGYDKMGGRLQGRGKEALGFVVMDARIAVEQAQTQKIGTSANLIYLKRKMKYIFLGMFSLALILGPGEMLVAIALKLVQDIMSIFL